MTKFPNEYSPEAVEQPTTQVTLSSDRYEQLIKSEVVAAQLLRYLELKLCGWADIKYQEIEQLCRVYGVVGKSTEEEK